MSMLATLRAELDAAAPRTRADHLPPVIAAPVTFDRPQDAARRAVADAFAADLAHAFALPDFDADRQPLFADPSPRVRLNETRRAETFARDREIGGPYGNEHTGAAGDSIYRHWRHAPAATHTPANVLPGTIHQTDAQAVAARTHAESWTKDGAHWTRALRPIAPREDGAAEAFGIGFDPQVWRYQGAADDFRARAAQLRAEAQTFVDEAQALTKETERRAFAMLPKPRRDEVRGAIGALWERVRELNAEARSLKDRAYKAAPHIRSAYARAFASTLHTVNDKRPAPFVVDMEPTMQRALELASERPDYATAGRRRLARIICDCIAQAAAEPQQAPRLSDELARDYARNEEAARWIAQNAAALDTL